ncbi:MAG TPA: hypothetical protein VM076_18220 [Gemmatimonadaceae bacterium]|nr:hypothetical protein [Gemmatimonadaceae bacterium]
MAGALAARNSGARARDADRARAVELPAVPARSRVDRAADRAFAAINRSPERQREVEEMVGSGNIAAIREIPNLSVEPTAALCDAARESIIFHTRRVRPGAGAHASYSAHARDVEFYMPTVEWLGRHGCSMGDALAELETTASAYADSAERARVLARLAALAAAPFMAGRQLP